jgi:malate synthase
VTTLMANLADELRTDFLQARADLLAARREQQAKDTPAHRAAVTEQEQRLDAVLDLFLDLSDADWDVAQLPTSITVSALPSRSLT